MVHIDVAKAVDVFKVVGNRETIDSGSSQWLFGLFLLLPAGLSITLVSFSAETWQIGASSLCAFVGGFIVAYSARLEVLGGGIKGHDPYNPFTGSHRLRSLFQVIVAASSAVAVVAMISFGLHALVPSVQPTYRWFAACVFVGVASIAGYLIGCARRGGRTRQLMTSRLR